MPETSTKGVFFHLWLSSVRATAANVGVLLSSLGSRIVMEEELQVALSTCSPFSTVSFLTVGSDDPHTVMICAHVIAVGCVLCKKRALWFGRAQGAQHGELRLHKTLRVCVVVTRHARFHGHKRQHFCEMVLQHISHNTVTIVKACATPMTRKSSMRLPYRSAVLSQRCPETLGYTPRYPQASSAKS